MYMCVNICVCVYVGEVLGIEPKDSRILSHSDALSLSYIPCTVLKKFFLKIVLNLFILLLYMYTWKYVCVSCVCLVSIDVYKRVLDHLGLELQVISSCHVDSGK